MSCDSYPSKKDVEDFAINARVINEITTGTGDFTESIASDGLRKKTIASIMSMYRGQYAGNYAVNVTYDQYDQFYSYVGSDGEFNQWAVKMSVPLPYVATKPNPADDNNLTRFGSASMPFNMFRTVYDKLSDVVSVKDFGAIGSAELASQDLVDTANAWYTQNSQVEEPRFKAGWDTVDFVAIQWALDFALVNNKPINIPMADYVLSKCLIIKGNGVSIFGDGMWLSNLTQHPANWFVEASDDSQLLVGGKVYGSVDYGTGKKWSATKTFAANNFLIDGVAILGDRSIDGLLQSGLQIQGQLSNFSDNIVIRNCRFEGHGECGIEPSYVDGLTIEGCYATSNGWQFIGTDHAIKNVLITKNIAIEPADGSGESAFLDLEEGVGADYENIIVSNNIHIATKSGFVKVHPKIDSNIRNLQIVNNLSKSAGAATLGFYRHFWDGADNADLAFGNVENLTITGNTILGYAVNVFGIGSGESSSGKAKNVVVSGNIIETSESATSGSICFSIPKLVENCKIDNNIVNLNGESQYFSRISSVSSLDPTKLCKDISITNNDVRLKSAHSMIDVNQINGLTIEGNRFEADDLTKADQGGFLGLGPGGNKENITITNNYLKLKDRNLFLTYYQKTTNLTIEGNHIIHNTLLTKYILFGLNQQAENVVIRGNRVEAGAAPVLRIGDGAGTSEALKCKNIVFDGNEVTHAASDAFEPRQCENLTFSRNKITATAGANGLVCPLYTTAAFQHLEGKIIVQDNQFLDVASGDSAGIGIRLSFVHDSEASAIITGNLIKAKTGKSMSYPIIVEGNPKTALINNNTVAGVDDNRAGITLNGSGGTIEAVVTGNLTLGQTNSRSVDETGTVNATTGINHVSTG